MLHRSRDTTPIKASLPAAEVYQAAEPFQVCSASVLCRPCNSPWLNTVLERRHRLASPQGLPHWKYGRHASGHRVFSVGFRCYRTAQGLRVRQKASFCVAAGFPSTCCALPEPSPAGSAGPDIRLLRPQLQKQWHHGKNQHLGYIHIHPYSSLPVWWTCDQCPHGLPHEWLARINSRQGMDTQCPFCTNNKPCHHNSLLTLAPSAAASWDTAKNGLTADQVLAGSSIHRHWLCPTCNHSWQAEVRLRVHNNSCCPKCSKRSMGHTRQPTLTASNHPVMVEFDHSRNQEAGLDPDKITLGSHKKVHWVCSNCPRGQPHLFMASPNMRTSKKSGCPYCSSKYACIFNSLQSLYPALAAEWDSVRNGVGPDQILPTSVKLAYWNNAERHSWEQSPHGRTCAQLTRTKQESRLSSKCNKPKLCLPVLV